MPLWTRRDLLLQLADAKHAGLFAVLVEEARAHGLPPAYVLGISSRETNLQNEIGDSGHGHGILQIDDRWHGDVIHAHPDWRTHPRPLIAYGCGLLRANVAWARQEWPEYDAFKIAAAAYNAGQGGARRGVEAGDCDRFTTGADYGADVRARERLFAELLGSENR